MFQSFQVVKQANGLKSLYSFHRLHRCALSGCSSEPPGRAFGFSPLAALRGAGGDLGEPVHLIELVGAGPQNEFIDAHVSLTLDRFFHGGI